ncbi:MAG: pitrilysin family protein, partial [Thermoanaerobaculia bacterium]
LYGSHPYSRPILGTREAIDRVTVDHLREFHDRYYQPENAVLVVAGDVGREAFDRIDRILGGPARQTDPLKVGEDRPTVRPASRVRRSKGETPRLLMAMPGPAATGKDYAPLRVVAAVLGLGRTSRLYRSLVDEAQYLASVSVDVTETVLGGALLVSAEALPGISLDRIEESILNQLDLLAKQPPSDEELARARRLMKSDWVFSHQHAHQLASTTAVALGLFGTSFLADHLQALQTVSPEAVQRAARHYLCPREVGVTGWSHSGLSG